MPKDILLSCRCAQASYVPKPATASSAESRQCCTHNPESQSNSVITVEISECKVRLEFGDFSEKNGDFSEKIGDFSEKIEGGLKERLVYLTVSCENC